MRLKLVQAHGVRRIRRAMNQKNLNYEIETQMLTRLDNLKVKAMNQKNLNYEIETIAPFLEMYPPTPYESKESQL